MNEETNFRRTVVCEFKIILSSTTEAERVLFEEASERSDEIRSKFQSSVERRLPSGYQINKVQVRHGSVVISTMLILSGAGNFFLRYKDIRDNISQLALDFEIVVAEILPGRGRWPVHTSSKILPGPGFPAGIPSVGKAIIGTVLIFILVAIAVSLFEEAALKPPREVTLAIITNGVSINERILTVSCGHCGGHGTCTAERNKESCFTCKSTARMDEGLGRNVLCSVCQGRGYNIPEQQLLQTETRTLRLLNNLGEILLFGVLFWFLFRIVSGPPPWILIRWLSGGGTVMMFGLWLAAMTGTIFVLYRAMQLFVTR